MKNLVGKTWGELTNNQQEELLVKASCVDGITGNNVNKGECIVDIEDVSIPGKVIDGEIVIANDAKFYNPIA